MPKRKQSPEEIRTKILLWCSRHCCLCGKQCSTNIEIHHIDKNHNNNDIDNLIPLCFDCHSEIERYNSIHPKGNKYRTEEIKSRREQIYDLHTLKYIRDVSIKISNMVEGMELKRPLGDVSCTVQSHSKDIPIRMILKVEPFLNGQPVENNIHKLYLGEIKWNLNPSTIVCGHFEFPIKESAQPFLYQIVINYSIIDCFEREHKMLPFSYVWDDPQKGDWWFHPTDELLKKL